MTPRKRGRPALCPNNETSTDVHVRMSPALYDRAYAEASRRKTSVPELIRQAVVDALPRTDDFRNLK